MNRQNQKRISIIFIVILFTSSVSFCRAQDTTRAARIKETVVSFVSAATSPLTFKMGTDYRTLEVFTIKPDEPFYSQAYDTNPVFLMFTTTKRYVYYTLEIGKTYQFYWNAGRTRWDLREVTPE
ncbi:MAG: hypothetical protein NTU98_02905 [Bacteroidetes bacterium]|nr:hypothetical protein [Bacteroidota bacterium]